MLLIILSIDNCRCCQENGKEGYHRHLETNDSKEGERKQQK